LEQVGGGGPVVPVELDVVLDEEIQLVFTVKLVAPHGLSFPNGGGGGPQMIFAVQPALTTDPSDVNLTVRQPPTAVDVIAPGFAVPLYEPSTGEAVVGPL